MKVYFVRHGESVGNVQKPDEVITFEERDGLTPRGHEQAKRLGHRLEETGLTQIIVSPMRRAQETAANINSILNLPIETHADLFEVQQADAVYAAAPKDREDLRYAKWMPEHNDDPGYAPKGAESFNAILKRVASVRTYIEPLVAEHNILLVTHNGFLRFFLGSVLFGDAFQPIDFRKLQRTRMTNTGITIFEFGPAEGNRPEGWRLLTWNDQEHV